MPRRPASERGEGARIPQTPPPPVLELWSQPLGAGGASPPRESPRKSGGQDTPSGTPSEGREGLESSQEPSLRAREGVEKWGASVEPGASRWWSNPASLPPPPLLSAGHSHQSGSPFSLQSIPHQEHSISEDKKGHGICLELPADLWFQGQLCPNREKYDV